MDLLKIDSQGNAQWERSYGSSGIEEGEYVQQTTDGGYILVGSTLYGLTLSNVLLIKTDSLGDSLWASKFCRRWGDDDEEVNFGYYVEETIDGGFVIVGTTGYCEFSGEWYYYSWPWLIKTNSLGDSLWARTYSGDEGYSGQQTADGGYIITGKDYYDDLLLIKTDADGETMWSCTWGEEGEDCGLCVQQTSEGGYIIAGYPWTLIKTDENGDTLWSREYGMAGRYVQQTSDGGYIVIGTKDYDIYLLKTDSLGNLAVEEPPLTPQPDWQVISSIGHRITLRAPEGAGTIDLAVFDASGRQVDEIRLSSGAIQWGEGFSPGVYFIREVTGNTTTNKVVLVR